MAKLHAACILMGVGSNTYVPKGQKETVSFPVATLYFTDDNTTMPVGVDRNMPMLLAQIEQMKMVAGDAVIQIREFKGSKFLDLCAFVPSKNGQPEQAKLTK